LRERRTVETVTDTLVERADGLTERDRTAVVWGNPLLSTTPSSIAIRDLAERVGALEDLVRELEREVQRLVDQV
jgi:hypothetical protein